MQATYLAQQSRVNGYAAAVQRLQALENFKILRAPFDGVLINRSTDIGDFSCFRFESYVVPSGSGKSTASLR
jgi:multidrug resistance efflux pump